MAKKVDLVGECKGPHCRKAYGRYADIEKLWCPECVRIEAQHNKTPVPVTQQPKNTLRRTALKRSYIKQKPKESTGEYELFVRIYNYYVRKYGGLVSAVSGKRIDLKPGDDFFVNCFAHILSKAKPKYPHYILNPKNIVILTPQEHDFLDTTITDEELKERINNGEKWIWLFNYREQLRQQYMREHPKKTTNRF